MAGTERPSLSRRSTSISRGLRASAAWRRASAAARPDAVNDSGATDACRMAPTISSIGALLATKADAACSIARSMASVLSLAASTTIPSPGCWRRRSRTNSMPSPSGRDEATVTTSHPTCWILRSASGADEHSATIWISGCCWLMCRRPNLTRVWPSTMASRTVIVPPGMNQECSHRAAAGGVTCL